VALRSAALHEGVEHHLAACLVEIDGELVAVHGVDIAGTELDVEDARADPETGSRATRLGEQLALDERGRAAPGLTEAPGIIAAGKPGIARAATRVTI
jgi:hypothetical protein